MLLTVVAILFLAAFIRSAFGFGETLIGVPLLAFIMPVEMAAPLSVLVSVVASVIGVAQDWRDIHLRSAALLVVSSCFGIPIGLWLLTAVPEQAVKSLLGVVIILFSAYFLLSKSRLRLKSDRLAWAFGFAGGVLGGAYGMNGPPLVAYGSLRRWTPQQFRATLQGYFLPSSLLVMLGYWTAGLWTPEVTRNFLHALPAIFLAYFLGRMANRRIDSRSFVIYVHAGLILIGIGLFLQARAG